MSELEWIIIRNGSKSDISILAALWVLRSSGLKVVYNMDLTEETDPTYQETPAELIVASKKGDCEKAVQRFKPLSIT